MVNRNMSGVSSNFSNGVVPGSEGLWCDDLRHSSSVVGRPALFLDRDGIIIRDWGFISDPEKIDIIQDTVDLIRFANQAAIPVVVVTNQSGIDRNLFSWHNF